MFFIIGLGLCDLEDVTIKGSNAIKSSDRVYLEAYTSILLGASKEDLEKYYGKTFVIADREMVESNSDQILENADKVNVAFLVVGDPFGATTHTDLILRAIEKKIPYKIIHNASIMNAAGCCGLQLYNFGETVSICFWTDTWKPTSFCEKINENRLRGLHTLCLLDIKVKEKTIENIIKNRNIYEPPRFMSVSTACSQLYDIIHDNIECEEPNEDEQEDTTKKQQVKNTIFDSTLCVGLARVGSDSQSIVVDTLENLKDVDLGAPLHSLVVVGRLHPLETEFLRIFYRNDQSKFNELVDIHNKFYSS